MHSVLVVDDEPFVRVSLAALAPWEEEGFEFRHEASHGLEALETLARNPEIDLVLVDLSMPIMDGLEFLRRLGPFCEAHGRPVPAALVLSASNEFALVREAFTLGARDYLLKAEVTPDRMLGALNKACEGLGESSPSAMTILRRRHRDFVKRHLLLSLLTGAPEAASGEVLGELGTGIQPPFILIVHRVENVEEIQGRYSIDELDRFQDLIRRGLTQVLLRHGRGELLMVSPWLWVTWWPSPDSEKAQAYAQAARHYLDLYLLTRTEFSWAAVDRWESVSSQWTKLTQDRRVESRIVVQAKRYLREHHSDSQLSLEEVSRAVGVSKNHLSWEFSQETGETFLAYLTRIRIDRAKELLTDPACRVADAGEKVGYPNVEHFSRVFKKQTGISPNKWSDFAAQAG